MREHKATVKKKRTHRKINDQITGKNVFILNFSIKAESILL